MRWKITIEGLDEFGGRETAEMVIEKEFNRLSKGEIGRNYPPPLGRGFYGFRPGCRGLSGRGLRP
jgi:hypothetical protein